MIRLVWVQLAVLAVIAGVGAHWAVSASLWTGAAVVLVLAVGRWRRRWLSEWVGRYLGFRLRRGRRGALLDVVAPGAWVEGDHLHGPGGVVAVLRPRMAVPRVLAGLAGPDVRVVLHVGRGQVRRPRAWVAVQARRTPELWHDDEVVRVLGNSTRRTRRELRRQGVTTDLLAEDDLVTTIAALGHVTGRREVREEWRYWHSGPVAQACFRLPGATARTTVDWLLTAAPGVAVTVALTEADAVLRIAGAAEAAVEAAVGVISAHVRLERLDGLHARGVAASLLIGGVL
ncbi:type VII secretion protein EccE [Saccharothrix deserti]|uniref:type VII secretion protein EccE n=1 Tax=Saccharothrix deserti TaxID=2593674 RepID=UPI00131A62A4|nr:type VII secretion protein EccE [Saccharothrix deserti]